MEGLRPYSLFHRSSAAALDLIQEKEKKKGITIPRKKGQLWFEKRTALKVMQMGMHLSNI